MGRRAAHRHDPRPIVGAAELDLEQSAAGCFGCLFRHDLGLGERDRVGGDERLRRRQAGELVHRPAGALGREVPERAIERVAGGARRHRLLQAAAIEPACDLAGQRRDGLGDAIDGLAIARIGHAFAAAAVVPVAELGDHDRSLRLGAPADREAAGDRPVLDAHCERDR